VDRLPWEQIRCRRDINTISEAGRNYATSHGEMLDIVTGRVQYGVEAQAATRASDGTAATPARPQQQVQQPPQQQVDVGGMSKQTE
jgi:hypothetical protein